jgi:hypothetical protein
VCLGHVARMGVVPADFAAVTWPAFFTCLMPVTIGNSICGAFVSALQAMVTRLTYQRMFEKLRLQGYAGGYDIVRRSLSVAVVHCL